MSSYLTGDYSSMAEAVGEGVRRGLAFTPGVDFDPTDREEVEIVLEASHRDYRDRMGRENARLEQVNAELRQRLIDAGLLDPDD